MKKAVKILSLILAVVLALSLVGCGTQNDVTESKPEKTKAYVGTDMSVACLKGPTGVGMTRLM